MENMSFINMDKFIGIDPSLSGNAIVVINKDGVRVDTTLMTTYKDCYINNEQRVWDLFRMVRNFIRPHWKEIKFICIEDLPYMGNSGGQYERCALLYSILMWFLEKDVRYKSIPVKTLKKFVTGTGNADKSMMIESVNTRWFQQIIDDNIADAYGLAQMALAEWRKLWTEKTI